jgi:16S rRNA (cytosine1407-C5)-methyltransferase
MNKLPEGFIERLNRIWSPEVVSSFVDTFKERPPTIRINTLKGSREETLAELKNQQIALDTIPWYDDAFIVANRTKREITELPLYQQGRIYIQSLASMIPPLFLDPKPGETILDLTAAPGSKTSQIAALMNGQGELVANDNSRERFFRLKRNMEALGVTKSGLNLTLRLEHGSKLGREYQNYFDKVLLDAPCSAEARFIAGDSKSFGYWKEKKLSEIAKRQRPLLLAALNALKPGGILVYSTCTLSPEENELQIDWLNKKCNSKNLTSTNESEHELESFEENKESGHCLSRFNLISAPDQFKALKTLPPISAWKEKSLIPEIKNTFRIMPTDTIEGFFIAKLKKL